MIKKFFGNFLFFVLFCTLQKPLFMLYHHRLFAFSAPADYMEVMWHGLPLDLAVAAYLSVIPAIIFILYLWWPSKGLKIGLSIYYAIVSLILSLVFLSDLILYGYWGFRLDTTPVFYFLSSPKDALAGATPAQLWLGGLCIVALSFLLWYLCHRLFCRPLPCRPLLCRHPSRVQHRGFRTAVLCFLLAALFVPIRGGFSVATLNTGRVYYSDHAVLNHAAVNPCFSFLESLGHQTRFRNQYRFMPDSEAAALFHKLQDKTFAGPDSGEDSLAESDKAAPAGRAPVQTAPAGRAPVQAAPAGQAPVQAAPAGRPPLRLSLQRPNIFFIVLESFMSRFMQSLGGLPHVAVHLDTIAQSGVLFTHFYANSFRTDRGLVAILSGYPAQPTTSIMKYPHKTQHLPSLPAQLKKEGYTLNYYYGGNPNFCNMQSYLISMGFTRIVSSAYFPLSNRLSKWGVHDHLLFEHVMQELDAGREREPFFKVIQTSSSHEPFTVPFRRPAIASDPKLNAIAYTDSCVGVFMDHLRKSPYWDRSLVVLVADHAMQYPDTLDNLSPKRYEIPLIFCGGALQTRTTIDAVGSQHDIAATLLALLGLSHADFPFSKDILNPANPHFAFFTFPDAFGFIADSPHYPGVVYDNTKAQIVSGRDSLLRRAQAYLQTLYDDLAQR